KIIPELPDNLIVAWLKGYVDGDGWVSLRGVKIKDIGIATAEKEEAELVQSLLLRLGIIAKIQKSNIPKTFGKINGREVRTKKIKYNIIIGGMEHIKKFYSLISFRQLKRANTLSEGIKNAVQPSLKSDVVPVGNSLCRFRIENNLFQYELGFSDQTIRQAEKNSQCLTRINLQKIVSLKPLLGSAVEKLRLLAFSDILWDRIVDIKIVPDEEYVYDLTVETGNFVANNIVMHNCSIAYGGELPAEELVRLVRFANRVPLLYQQSACATYKSILETNWRNYSVSQSKGALPTAPMVIMVHMASVWVPFTSESKEAIAHYPEIIKELKLALQECGRQLALFLSRRRRAEHEANKKSYIETYIPHIGVALKDILSLKEDDTKKVEKHLKEILEKHRGSEHDENIN
ncbi:hypothetical protein FJZ53_07110, partial [Candidatus Woesearchaeota archaeon]|nr:hypothetical protein [Candidatus Woesearchaeota archaeon]